jgi:hypothetical protein
MNAVDVAETVLRHALLAAFVFGAACDPVALHYKVADHGHETATSDWH